MSYEYDPITNKLIDLDPSSNDLGKRLLNNISIFDDEPRSMDQEPKKKKSLNPKEYKQMMNYLTRSKKPKIKIQKDSIEPQRTPLKNKSDTKVPPKIAKSEEDIKEEFETFEIPMIMKDFEKFLLDNPGKSFRDFLREQKLINEKEKKRLDDMILAGAIAKIEDRMSGIMQNLAKGGIIRDPSFTYYNSGGKVKRPPPIKKLNLADYFKFGMTIAELTDKERELVNSLLKKSFQKSSTDN